MNFLKCSSCLHHTDSEYDINYFCTYKENFRKLKQHSQGIFSDQRNEINIEY